MALKSMKETRESLLDAKAKGTLVRFRSRFEDGYVHGYVSDVGAKFFLMRLVSEYVRYDGYECLRFKDVRGVKPAPMAAFKTAALALRYPERAPDPVIDLNSTEGLLLSASALYPLICLHRERKLTSAFWIGKMTNIHKGRVLMRTVAPDATWECGHACYSLKSITRVGFGGDYEGALDMVAGPPRD